MWSFVYGMCFVCVFLSASICMIYSKIKKYSIWYFSLAHSDTYLDHTSHIEFLSKQPVFYNTLMSILSVKFLVVCIPYIQNPLSTFTFSLFSLSQTSNLSYRCYFHSQCIKQRRIYNKTLFQDLFNLVI